MCRYPRPRYVIFDNGTEFTSEFRELLLSYGITPKQTTIKNPQANSIVERIHLVIANSLRAMNLSSRQFDDTSIDGILQSIAWGLRSAYHTSLQTTPGHLTFGRDMVIHATYLANWHAIRQRNQSSVLRNNARENRKRQRHTYRVGDVFVSNQDIKRKLAVKEGPFPITKVHTNGTITIHRSTAVFERINIRRVHPVF